MAKPILYINCDYGGPEAVGNAWHGAIRSLDRVLGDMPSRAHIEGSVDEPGAIEAWFDLPGSLLKPDYEGVRTGSVSRRLRIVQVQVAVPEAILRQDEAAIQTFLLTSLRDGIGLAAAKFAKLGIPFEPATFYELLDRVDRSVSPN